MIRILRQHHAYAVKDSTHLECIWKIIIEASDEAYALLPVPDCLADLQVSDGNGEELVVIPDGMLKERLGIDQDTLRDALLNKITARVKNGSSTSLSGYRILPIVLGERSRRAGGMRYETINLRWIRPMSLGKSRGLTRKSTFAAHIVRDGFSWSADSSIYVSIKLGRGLHFAFEPRRKQIIGSPPPAKIIMSNDAVHAVRFGGTEDPNRLEIIVECIVHPAMKRWSALGVAIGLAIPALLLFATALEVDVDMSFEMLAGTVALLMAFRWFAFEDLPIMQRWEWLILAAVAFNALALLALYVPWQQMLGVAAS